MKILNAYIDNKCYYGYMIICNECLGKQPKHVDITKKINKQEIPNFYKILECELCKNQGKL